MILGRGTAYTDNAIFTEYHHFLEQSDDVETGTILDRLKDAPRVMKRRIGQPIAEWSDDDIFSLYVSRTKTVRYGYSAFVAFLIFRGYHRPALQFCKRFPLGLTRYHRQALRPIREKLEETQQKLGYFKSRVGSELNLLIFLLAMAQKPLSELTRLDFDAFRDEYQKWYRAQGRKSHASDPRLTRLEFYLVHWGVLPPRKIVFRHEEHFAKLRPGPIRDAVVNFLQWGEAKHQPSTIRSRQAGLLNFFLWFQEQQPFRNRLDAVTRPMALAYANHLKALREQGKYSISHSNDMYRSARLFFEFVIRERLKTSPDRNPFALGDTPWEPDAIPRYLADHEIRKILDYCEHEASLKERTLVIALFHTGIRAAELAELKATDIVEIQGRWKLHIHEGKGLKDRLVPLTQACLEMLRRWQEAGWEQANDFLFTRYGRHWQSSNVGAIIRELGLKLGVENLTPHRFRHTFAVALLNYGMRESALQKVMGHATLNMTLEYARILDKTVEQAFSSAVEQMHEGPISWVPSFFATEDYALFAEGDAASWIRLPYGYCRRNPKLHCESDVKCLLCDRFVASVADLPRFREIHDRFTVLGLPVKADVVAAQIHRLEAGSGDGFIPVKEILVSGSRPDSYATPIVVQ